MNIHGDQVRCDVQAVDAGFLGGLSQCCRDNVVVGVLAVPAQLHPTAKSRMQSEQDLAAGVVEHQRRGGDMSRYTLAKAGVVARMQERQHRVPQ
jgi:hypothetical protein